MLTLSVVDAVLYEVEVRLFDAMLSLLYTYGDVFIFSYERLCGKIEEVRLK